MYGPDKDEAWYYAGKRFCNDYEGYTLAMDKIYEMYYGTNKIYKFDDCKKVIDEFYEECQKRKGN